jgi:branched-chain amino acid transport system ATP-binding protein
MSEPLLSINGVTKRFGNFVAVSDISVAFAEGERVGIIGPNGSGKTTFINCIAGRLRPDSGSIRFAGRDVTVLEAHKRAQLGIARTFQIPQPFQNMTLIENLYVPLDFGARKKDADAKDIRQSAMDILGSLGLAAKADARCDKLSQIELRKLELARALAGRPRLLISDEAMAGLSSAEVDEVLAILFSLAERGITVVMIEHIMRAIMRFSERVLCIIAGKLVATGRPDEIVRDPQVRKAYFGE